MTPRSLGLEYDTWRPGQLEAIQRIVSSPKKYIVGEAPTGSGKSVIALAVGRMLNAQHTIVLTGTKQLQSQYVGTSREIVDVRGRGNFICNVEPFYKADEAKCTVNQKCHHAGPNGEAGCDYYDQKRAAIASPECVMNYAYFLAEFNYAPSFPRPDLLVCDEAHTIEEHIRQFATIYIGRRVCATVGVDYPEYQELTWEEWKEWAEEADKAVSRISLRGVDRNFARTVIAFDRQVNALRGIDEDWIIKSVPRGTEFRPVWINKMSGRYLLQHAEKVVFLSATVRPMEMFCEQLGIDPDEAEFIEVPSTFPKSRRPLYYRSVGKLKHGDEQVLRRLVDKIDDILDEHPNQKGLIHTVSYQLAQYIMQRSRYPERLITHQNQDREDQLAAFKQATKGMVLVSPSMTTGVDLPYDDCRFQIICKLPFPNLGDEQVKKRMKMGPNGRPSDKGQSWFNWSTACTLVQMYGRGMRAADDTCDTYLLDGNWEWFRPANKAMFPPWFLEAIVKEGGSGTSISIDQLFAKR